MTDTNWLANANCAGSDTTFWFPNRHTEYSPAYLICAGCTVRRQCLEDDLHTIVEEGGLGIRAGLIPHALRHLRRMLQHERNDRNTLISIATREHQTLDAIAKLTAAHELKEKDFLTDFTGTVYKVHSRSDGDDQVILTLIRPDAYKTERRWTIPVRPGTNFWLMTIKPTLPKRPKRKR